MQTLQVGHVRILPLGCFIGTVYRVSTEKVHLMLHVQAPELHLMSIPTRVVNGTTEFLSTIPILNLDYQRFCSPEFMQLVSSISEQITPIKNDTFVSTVEFLTGLKYPDIVELIFNNA